MDLNAATIVPPRETDAARFAMQGGVAPRRAWRPENAGEVADAVKQCAAEGLSLVPWGGGVALAREPAPERYDVALDLTAMKRVTIHDPEDFTVTAECGITVADLRQALAEARQELPLEAAEAWGATLGGVLAANASAARRRVFGSPRDRILGARFVTGDGVVARTGGRVVKNVAGHAVHRLLVGSRGSLGILLEASLKLLPEPPSRIGMAWGADAATLANGERWRDWPRREPAVLTLLGRAVASLNPVLASDAPYALVAGFEDDAAWTEHSATFARDSLGIPRIKVQDASVPPLWQQLADAEEMPGPRLTFTTAANTPDAIAFLHGRPVAERLVFHAACGRLHLWPAPDEAAPLVTELMERGFLLLDARGVPGIARQADPALGPLRRRLSQALDPAGVLAMARRG